MRWELGLGLRLGLVQQSLLDREMLVSKQPDGVPHGKEMGSRSLGPRYWDPLSLSWPRVTILAPEFKGENVHLGTAGKTCVFSSVSLVSRWRDVVTYRY